MENKTIEKEAKEISWTEKRSAIRKLSDAGSFVRKSLQNLKQDDALLALEARVKKCTGLARSSALGLRMLLETMVYGKTNFILFEEAFHIYSSFFSSCIDEQAFRDKLLNPDDGLNVVIVTHPTTLKRYVVLNDCDISLFLDEFTQNFFSKDVEVDKNLDRDSVSQLLSSMDTEFDRSVLRAVIALLHTRSQTLNLGIDPTAAKRKVQEVIEISEECKQAAIAGEDIVNLRLKERVERVCAEISEKEEILRKKREVWPEKRISDLEESIQQLKDRLENTNKLLKREDMVSTNKVKRAAKRVACSLLEENRVKRRKLGAGRRTEMGEDEEDYLLQSIEEMSTAHGRRHDTILYMNHRVKARDMLHIVNHRRAEKNKRPLKSVSTVLARGKAKRAKSIQAKRHKGRSLFCCKKPPKTEEKETVLKHHQRAHVKNAVYDFGYKAQDRKYSFIKSIDDKAYVRPGTSVGLRDVKRSGIYQPTDSSTARKLPKYDWVNEQVYVTPSTHRIFTKEPREVDGREVFVMSEDDSFVFMRPKAFVGSSGSVWASEDMELRALRPDLYEVEGSNLSIEFRGYCARIKDKIEHFILSTNEHDVCSVSSTERDCVYRQYENHRLLHCCTYLESAMTKCNVQKMNDHEKTLCTQVHSMVDSVTSHLLNVKNSTHCSSALWQEYSPLLDVCRELLNLLASFSLPLVKPRVLELTDAGPGVGCNNNEVQFRTAEKVLIHKLDKIVRVHRASGDSGQNEAERTNSAIGDALVTGETLNWEFHKQFENMSKEEIEALTMQDYEKLEQERMEKNAWRAASDLAERVDGEPAPHGYISCRLTPRVYEQFYFDKEYMNKYIATKSPAEREKLPGYGYFSMLDHFYTTHCKRGELYIEFLKGSCVKTDSDNEYCEFCREWSGPTTGYVPRPYPDSSKQGYHYMKATTTPLTDQEGNPREIDDFQPRAQLRTLFYNGEISSSDEIKIHNFSKKYIVHECIVREYILHLEHLELLKRKRKDEKSQKKKERDDMTYENYNWKELYETRQIKGLRVAELDKYVTKHKLTNMKLKKKDKVTLVETHIAMTMFQGLSIRQNDQDDDDADEDYEDMEDDSDEEILLELEQDSGDESDEESGDQDELCICSGYDDGRFMICCDQCDDWFHGDCIGLDETERKEYAENEIPYICPFCKAN